MFMTSWKRKISMLLATSLLAGSIVVSGQPAAAIGTEPPHLLITEIVPDSADVGVEDGYEFVEIYNNSNKPVNIKDYMIIYRYPDTTANDRYWRPFSSSTVIPSKGVLVLWTMTEANRNLTVANFNTNYGTSLVENSTLVRMPGGMHDVRDRVMVLATNTGLEIATARYNQGAIVTSPNKGLQYGTPDPGSKAMKLLTPQAVTATPGVVSANQVPAQPNTVAADSIAPVAVDLTPASVPDLMKPIELTLQATDDKMVATAALKYKAASDTAYKTAYMIKGSDDVYKHALSYEEWYGSPTLTYYFEVSDGTNTVTTSVKTISLTGSAAALNLNVKNYDTLSGSKVIFADGGSPDNLTLTIDGTGGNKALTGKATLKFDVQGVDAGQNVVTMGSKTLGTFKHKTNYETVSVAMNADEFVLGSANTIAIRAGSVNRPYFEDNPETGLDDFSVRNIRLVLANGLELRAAGYTNTTTVWNMGDDGEFLPVIYLNFTIPSNQWVQDLPIEKTLTEMPKLVFEAKSIDAGQNVIAVGNEVVQLIPKGTTSYATVTVPMSPRFFKYGQANPIAFRAGSVNRPYFENTPEGGLDDFDIRNVCLEFSDGTVVRDPQYANPTLNFDMGDDGRFLPVVYFNFSIPESKWEKRPVKKAISKPAYFVFEANGIDKGQTFVTIGEEKIKMIPWNTSGFSTIVVPISPEYLQYGEKIPIAIRAGSGTKTYFEHDPAEAVDDYDIRNVRLILSDGTVIRDPLYASPTVVLDMGDNGRFLPIVYFNFPIPEAKWNAISYRWNTAGVTDGPHQVKVMKGTSQFTANVTTDNSGPVISTNIGNNQNFKGLFTIQAEASDVSQVASMEVTLDGAAITVPYTTSSGLLTPGAHVLNIVAKDKLGLTATKNVSFTTPVENPHQPELIAPLDGSTDVSTNANLQVKVTDPSGDAMEVKFYRGQLIDASSDAMTIYTNSADREPPLTIAAPGETQLGTADKFKMSASDNTYMTTDSTTAFPYHRFEVEVGSQIGTGDTIELNWEGHSLAGRKVTMYAWSNTANKWEALTSHIAQNTSDFALAASIDAGNYVNSGKIQVMVQDLIPARSQYDYTFVVMPDTQLYTEIYPSHFQDQVEWIRDNKTAMNIQYVAHVGDIVNTTPNLDQWNRADQYMQVLEDANIPYGVAAGNHDVHDGGVTGEPPDYTLFNQFFGENRFKDKPYYGGSYLDNRGHYDLISASGNDYIFVYVGWGLDQGTIDWTNEVLQQYPERKGVIVTHEYLNAQAARSATGNKLYNEVVVPNSNVELVISGHFTGSAVRSDAIDDNKDGIADRTVHQMLADYQGVGEGGSGYLKLLHFDTQTNRVYVNTYSPVLNDYNYYEPAKDEWTLTMNLAPLVKRVATDKFEVRVLTDEQIGSTVQAASGATAQAAWNGLAANATYYWYAVAEDLFGGRTASSLWKFQTGAGAALLGEQEQTIDDNAEGQAPDGEGDDQAPVEEEVPDQDAGKNGEDAGQMGEETSPIA